MWFCDNLTAASLIDPWSRPEKMVGVTKKEANATKIKIAEETMANSRETLKDIFFKMICRAITVKIKRKNPPIIQE